MVRVSYVLIGDLEQLTIPSTSRKSYDSVLTYQIALIPGAQNGLSLRCLYGVRTHLGPSRVTVTRGHIVVRASRLDE